MSLEATVDAAVGADAVTFTLTVENAGDDPVELSFSNAQRADFAVLDGDEEVWRHSDGQMFAQMLGSETVPAGGQARYDADWGDPSPGDYEVVGSLVARSTDVEARTSFSV